MTSVAPPDRVLFIIVRACLFGLDFGLDRIGQDCIVSSLSYYFVYPLW